MFLAPTDAHREAIQRSIETIQSAAEDAILALPSVPTSQPNDSGRPSPTPVALSFSPMPKGRRSRGGSPESDVSPASQRVKPARFLPKRCDTPNTVSSLDDEEGTVSVDELSPPYPSRDMTDPDENVLRPIRRHSVPFIPPQEVETLFDWDFDTLSHTPAELHAFLFQMFCDLDLIAEFNIPVPALRLFLQRVQSLYFDNPYHNFWHAFDVTQALMVFVSRTQLARLLSPLDKLTLLLSGICHDLEHPGTNNNYQVNALTPLSFFYNDRSVLENHHCAKAFSIIHGDPDLDIFAGLCATCGLVKLWRALWRPIQA